MEHLPSLLLVVVPLAVIFFLTIAILKGLFRRNVMKQSCGHCQEPFSAEAARNAVDFYERRLGPNIEVDNGPAKYNGSLVVKCQHCRAEFVMSATGHFVEEYDHSVEWE
jgi:hypothetical protein